MNDNHYPKLHRVRSKADFKYLRTCRNSVRRGNFVVYFGPTLKENSSKTRLGISVSKKYGKAVARNKMKRHIREFFRTSPFKELGKDTLVVALRQLAQQANRRDISRFVAQDLGHLFERIKQKG